MKLHRLKQTKEIPIGIEDAWRFFSDPSNLARITPPEMGFLITSPELPMEIHAGLIITYRVRVLPPLSLGWVTEITQARPPHFFIDEQRFGPYRFWHHQHHFEEIAGGTRTSDIVHYALPFGPLGSMAHALFVRRRLRQIFDFREQALTDMFGTTASPSTAG